MPQTASATGSGIAPAIVFGLPRRIAAHFALAVAFEVTPRVAKEVPSGIAPGTVPGTVRPVVPEVSS